MNNHDWKLIQVFIIVIIGKWAKADDIFPTPEILRDNVAFWKKIYTEVSLDEGLLHDRDYPLVIYEKITVKTSSSRQRSRIIENEKDKIKSLLYTLSNSPESSWSSSAKKIAELFRTHASGNALNGATTRIRFQQGQMERFKQGLYRSGAYLDSIRIILQKYNIPKRLIYLPHVESSFNPEAYSKVGAAGLWQFMRSTGKRYLKINYLIDERRDPLLSTYAAAKLLSYNYSKLKSWPLAITAYNHGLNGIRRAVAQTGSRDIAVIIQKHRSRSFQFASKNFYSCFLAASEIAANPNKYFKNLTFAPQVEYNNIKLDYYIRPNDLASNIKISKSELQSLNPSMRASIFTQNRPIPKGIVIHIPKRLSLKDVSRTLDDMPDSLKIKAPPRPNYYKVRKGDNLYAIARRLGVSARELASENDISRMNKIYAGQILRVPGSTTKQKKEVVYAKEKSIASEKTVKKQKSSEKVNTKPKAMDKEEKAIAIAKPKTPIPQEQGISDSLDELLMATAENVPESKILIKTKQAFKFDVQVYNLDVKFSHGKNKAEIYISFDETIGHYAEWLEISTQRIRGLNSMGNRSSIRINQKIIIPADQDAVEKFNRRRLEYHMALEEDFYSQFKVVDVKPKIVKRGETLWDICHEDDIIPLWLLKKYNKHIYIGRLFPNMKILVPVVEERTEDDFVQEQKAQWRGIYPAYREPVSQVKPYHLVP
jgi:membrane-bound lytic murein transglycosylase D